VELRQLRYFVAVAEEHHFGRAASRLRIATPSLSQQIRALERDLRVTLLDRDTHGVALTPAGAALLGHARALLSRAARARDDVRTAGTEALSVRVATGAEHLIAGRLRAVADAGVDVRIAVTHGTDAVYAVREERADAAIVWLDPGPEQNLARTTLSEVPVLLALPTGHPLGFPGGAVPVAALAGETILLFPRHLAPAVWDRLRHHLRPEGPDRVAIEPDQLGAASSLLTAVAAGRGLAPAISRDPAVTGIVVRPLEPPLTLPLEIVWREPAGVSLQRLIGLLTASAG
jgi:DNA-binding transcriptional LysR family regulator